MEYKENDNIRLKNGQVATIMNRLGGDYLVEIATSTSDWETRLISPEEIAGEWKN